MVTGQLGVAMTGMTVGLLVGPAAGGGLYTHFGYRGPFVLGISMAVVDLIGRLLIIERKTALLYGHDPWGSAAVDTPAPATNEPSTGIEAIPSEGAPTTVTRENEKSGESTGSAPVSQAGAPTPQLSLSLPGVLLRLVKSPRALVALMGSAIFGFASLASNLF